MHVFFAFMLYSAATEESSVIYSHVSITRHKFSYLHTFFFKKSMKTLKSLDILVAISGEPRYRHSLIWANKISVSNSASADVKISTPFI